MKKEFSTTKKLEVVEIRKHCSRPLMNFEKKTPKTLVFLAADVFTEFLPQLARN